MVAASGVFGGILSFGQRNQSGVVDYVKNSSIIVNLSETGSLEKVVMKVMAIGKMVVTSGEVFKDMLSSLYLFVEKKTERERYY